MPYTSAAQIAISNVVIPVSYFVDHVKQLTLVKNNLIKYRQTSLVGISGMGKTQLARMYAYENKNNYDLIWFIDCTLDINEEFLKLAKSINEKTKTNLISEDVGSAKKEVLYYLSSKDKWLLVFDNLKIKENHKIQEFINWEHNGHVIFASQDGELLPNTVKMTAFEKNDATALVNNILEKGDSKLADFLVQEFIGYPVLIVQGAQLLNQVPGLDQEEYKRKIQQSTDKIKLNIILATNELKTSTKKLLNKISLLNNQSFSKELLKIITDDQSVLDDDLYQLSKLALIANIDPNENNPIFEMHDVIANKIMEINGNKNNKVFLEQIIDKIVKSIPTTGKHSGYIFYRGKTIHENLKVITDYEGIYNISIYKLLSLNLLLLQNYVNRSEYYKAEKLFNWFNKNDQEEKFKLWLMDNDTMLSYARYLVISGGYCKTRLVNWNRALEYYLRAKKVLEKVKGYPNIKCNVLYNIVNAHIALGQIQEASNEINMIEASNDFSKDIKANGARIIKSKLYYYIGNEEKALAESNKEIQQILKSGIKYNDIYLTHNYLLRAEILNSLGKYQEAMSQAKELYEMHNVVTIKDHEVFARIYTQMSRAELGLGNTNKALEYAQKATSIFINDPSRPNQHLATSPDTELAKAFFAEADALTALGQNENAVHSYLKAEMLYWNNYKDNLRNVDEVSRMYLAAAKASCHLSEKAWYIKFHDQHISKFGADHPRSVEILKMDSVCYPESQR